ncbi:MAG: hypothetical protein ACFFAS_09935 [Promethearchaeota archaeon]
MLKLYKKQNKDCLYWETWENEGVHTIHWGNLGETGMTEEIKDSKAVEKLIEQKISEGYEEIDIEDHYTLLIEYEVDGFGDSNDLDKRYELQDRMDETLGWTGLGHCDGGSIGSGTMEVCCFVVNFELAKKIIEEDLKGTEFADYTRIYDENLE